MRPEAPLGNSCELRLFHDQVYIRLCGYAALSRMGWEEMKPLDLNGVTRQDKARERSGGGDRRQASILEFDDPDDFRFRSWRVSQSTEETFLLLLLQELLPAAPCHR